jgi:hypothetical protein
MRHVKEWSAPLAAGAFVAVLLAAGAGASAVTVWDEAISGDLSNDRANPTLLPMLPGTNSLSATSVAGDREFVRFTIAPGLRLDSVFLRSYSSADGIAFVGAQRGTSLTESPDNPNPANLLGYSHFGPGAGNVGADLLPQIGAGPGSQGFIPPLGAGDYTFWLQQTGGSPTTYSMDFVVTPEPTAVGLLALTAAGLLYRRRRGGRV